MPISAIMIAALAPLTGALFGASYGTAIRIGYEIIFPSLFGDSQGRKVPLNPNQKDVLSSMEGMYTRIGGLEAHKFGINQGMNLALSAAKTGEGSNLMDLALGNARIQGGEVVLMSDTEIEARRGRTTEQPDDTPGTQLPGDYLDSSGNIRNETLDSFSAEKIKDMMILISRKQIPANWPSNWIKLIPEYNVRHFKSRADEGPGGRDVSLGPDVPTRPQTPQDKQIHNSNIRRQEARVKQTIARAKSDIRGINSQKAQVQSGINGLRQIIARFPNVLSANQKVAKRGYEDSLGRFIASMRKFDYNLILVTRHLKAQEILLKKVMTMYI